MRLTLSILVIGLLLSACVSESAATPTALPASDTPPPTLTYTPEPSSTPTTEPTATTKPTNTPESTATTEPTPEVPREFGEIAYTEMHKGERYAISVDDRAVAVFRGGEWKEFERPVIQIAHPDMMDEMANLMEAAESVDEKRLLTQDGNPLPYGVLSTEMYDEDDGREDWREMVFLSGFVIGAHLREGADSAFQRATIYIEIPLRYQRVAFAATTPHLDTIQNIYQFSEASIPLDEDGKFDMHSMEAIAIENPDVIERSMINEEEFVRTMQNPENTGVQILVGFVYKGENPPENYAHALDVYQEYISELERGELDENVYYITNIGTFGIPDGLFEGE